MRLIYLQLRRYRQDARALMRVEIGEALTNAVLLAEIALKITIVILEKVPATGTTTPTAYPKVVRVRQFTTAQAVQKILAKILPRPQVASA